MKKVGKEVLWLSCSDENPRNGEGAFIRLKDGKIVTTAGRELVDEIEEKGYDIF